MKIAILAWGSLYWDLGCLNLKDEDKIAENNWKADGVKLPIEFSRVSNNGRLTLVIDDKNRTDINTYWAISKYEILGEAIENLRFREGSKYKRIIGYVDLIKNIQYSYNDNSTRYFDKIKDWAKSKSIDAVIWTDLQSNFKSKFKEKYSCQNAMKYLNSLTDYCQKEEAKKYIEKAPENTQTKFRSYYNDI